MNFKFFLSLNEKKAVQDIPSHFFGYKEYLVTGKYDRELTNFLRNKLSELNFPIDILSTAQDLISLKVPALINSEIIKFEGYSPTSYISLLNKFFKNFGYKVEKTNVEKRSEGGTFRFHKSEVRQDPQLTTKKVYVILKKI